MTGFLVFESVLVTSIVLTNIILLWTTVARVEDKKVGTTLGAFIFLVTLWIAAAYLSEVFQGEVVRIILSKVAYVAVTLALPALIKFLATLNKSKNLNSIFWTVVVVVPAIVLSFFFLFTNTLIKGLIANEQSFDIVFGELLPIHTTYVVVSLAVVGFLLFQGYNKSIGREKRAFQILIAGIALFVIGNVIANVITPLLTGDQLYYRFGNYSVIFFTSLTVYSIVSHNLFDIRALAASILALVINVVLFSQVFLSSSPVEAIVKVIINIVVAVGSYSLIKNISIEIERRKEIEELAKEKIETLKELEQRNKSLAALQRVSDIVLNEMDMKAMSQKILDEIPVQLENCVGAFLSIVRGGHLVAYTVSTNTFTRKVYSLVGEDLEKYSYPIKKEFNGLHEVLIEKKMVEGDSLDAFICPPISRPVAKTLQRLIGAKHLVALPLYASGEPLGVMMFVYKVEKSRLHGKDVEIAKAIADDMSLAIQRAQAFQKLKDANEYLSQLDKMKDEFISMASHELNTPLAAIEGYLSMVLDEGMGKVDAKSKEYLSRAYASSKRLAELILDLLNVSRIEQGRLKMKFSQVSMVELAESVVHELQIKADSKKIYLKIEAEKGLPKLWCDPDRIREVIVNLTGNALKFTDKGGVTINIGKSEGDFIRVTVVDTGRGIAKEDQKKLFQKFSQVKREIDEHQGTGLGLYISKNFVELHKGKIWVESEAGKGSKFIFEIPLLKEAPKQLEGAILEKPITEAQIEVGTKDVPTIIAESVDGKI